MSLVVSQNIFNYLVVFNKTKLVNMSNIDDGYGLLYMVMKPGIGTL